MKGKFLYAGCVLIAASFAATMIAYPQLPKSIPMHWDIHGQPNGYSPKWMAYIFGPGFLAMGMALTWLLPRISPMRFKIDAFRSTYEQLMLILMAIVAYCDGVLLWVGVGHKTNPGRAILAGVCLFLILQGNLMGKIRRNFFVGVRTPWALANERVWNATHRLAAKTFVVGGLLGFTLMTLLQSVWPSLAAVVCAAAIPAVYSLVFSKQLERRGEL